ncbi:hypothetical protein ACNAUY_08350 [Acinetobacter tibetensis]|uniref:hypothetical protein n=1 Tax=Acinetobacter tibetensis TaxID=2943497 RepID=UPI003A4E2434
MALVILSGQTRSGKRLIAENMIMRGYTKITTDTTRRRRSDEQDGLEYYFIDHETFNEAKEKGKYLETETFFGEQYGLSFSELLEAVESNVNSVVTLSPDGAKKLRKYLIANKMPHLMCFIDGDMVTILANLIKERDNNSLSNAEYIDKMVNYIEMEKGWVDEAKKGTHFDIFFDMSGDRQEEIQQVSSIIHDHVTRMNELPSSINFKASVKKVA